MIVVSPFSAGGYVCSDTFDHTSQLRFLETLLGVTVPNLSAWRRSATGDLTAALPVLTQPVTSAPILPTVSTKRNKRPLRECLPGAFDTESSGGIAPYRIPRHQVMPTQGPGTLIPTPT
jgi:phospholipase C